MVLPAWRCCFRLIASPTRCNGGPQLGTDWLVCAISQSKVGGGTSGRECPPRRRMRRWSVRHPNLGEWERGEQPIGLLTSLTTGPAV
jgi:hypothetical protein